MHQTLSAPAVAPVLSLARGTLVLRRDLSFGYAPIQARDIEVRRGPYAQHADVVFVSFTPRGSRTRRVLVGGATADLLVLSGWEPVAAQETHLPGETRDGVTVSRGRALSCDPMWSREARAMAAATGRLVADYH